MGIEKEIGGAEDECMAVLKTHFHTYDKRHLSEEKCRLIVWYTNGVDSPTTLEQALEQFRNFFLSPTKATRELLDLFQPLLTAPQRFSS